MKFLKADVDLRLFALILAMLMLFAGMEDLEARPFGKTLCKATRNVKCIN